MRESPTAHGVPWGSLLRLGREESEVGAEDDQAAAILRRDGDDVSVRGTNDLVVYCSPTTDKVGRSEGGIKLATP